MLLTQKGLIETCLIIVLSVKMIFHSLSQLNLLSTYFVQGSFWCWRLSSKSACGHGGGKQKINMPLVCLEDLASQHFKSIMFRRQVSCFYQKDLRQPCEIGQMLGVTCAL